MGSDDFAPSKQQLPEAGRTKTRESAFTAGSEILIDVGMGNIR